ncbi:hypothetical protein GCM10027589_01100 [Actinocorallia lasiicapitis]
MWKNRVTSSLCDTFQTARQATLEASSSPALAQVPSGILASDNSGSDDNNVKTLPGIPPADPSGPPPWTCDLHANRS